MDAGAGKGRLAAEWLAGHVGSRREMDGTLGNQFLLLEPTAGSISAELRQRIVQLDTERSGWVPDLLRPSGSGQAGALGAELCDSRWAPFLIS